MTASPSAAPATDESVEVFTKIKGERLEGAELQQLIAGCDDDVQEEEILRRAGYYIDTVDEAGNIVSTSYRQKEFYVAMAAAAGISFKPSKTGRAGGKNSPRKYQTVNKTGKVILNEKHIASAGFEIGSKVQTIVEPGKLTVVAYSDELEVA